MSVGLQFFLYFYCRWYFGKIKRMEAEKKLLLAQNEHGAFLIRDSESRRNDYSLSVRDGDTVKHYRIRQLDEGGFFIARRTTFRTLQELVDHYSRDADGLCVNLRKACIQVSLLKLLPFLFRVEQLFLLLWTLTYSNNEAVWPKNIKNVIFFSLFSAPLNGPAGGKRKNDGSCL